jgi:hypothetical protein
MEAQLQQLIELQTEQNELLKRYLWRIRFSLAALLLLTTALCCGMGFVAYRQNAAPFATPAKTTTVAPTTTVVPSPVYTLPWRDPPSDRYQAPK